MLFGLFRRRSRIRVDIASLSECGPVRADNQDHILVNRRSFVFCVADGMGGGEGGGKASEVVCRAISSAVARRTDFRGRIRLVDEAIRRADADVRDYAAKAGYRQMGSTATVVVADPDGGVAVVGNIGDSRVYRLRRGELRLLTLDHTMERELRQSGGRSAILLTDVQASVLSHVLTRAIGVGLEARIDWKKIDICEGDAFLLCSDGVYGVVPASGIKSALLSGGRAKDAVARLRAKVLAGGAPDNFSAIVVKIGRRA